VTVILCALTFLPALALGPLAEESTSTMRGYCLLEADWRRETLRTNLWIVPAVETLAVLLIFAGTTGSTVQRTTEQSAAVVGAQRHSRAGE